VPSAFVGAPAATSRSTDSALTCRAPDAERSLARSAGDSDAALRRGPAADGASGNGPDIPDLAFRATAVAVRMVPTIGVRRAKSGAHGLIRGRIRALMSPFASTKGHAPMTQRTTKTETKTKTRTTTKTTTATGPRGTGADERIRRIAEAQREIARLLNELGERVMAAEAVRGREGDALLALIRADRTGTTAKSVADGFATERIDTGSLSSRLIDALEADGLRPYPPPYGVERPRWAIVESR
jgi:hypothetical protein